jgi:hypothetical protein
MKQRVSLHRIMKKPFQQAGSASAENYAEYD